MFRSLLGQVLKLLARNVEANLHLFAQDGCSPTSANGTAAAAAAATTEAVCCVQHAGLLACWVFFGLGRISIAG